MDRDEKADRLAEVQRQIAPDTKDRPEFVSSLPPAAPPPSRRAARARWWKWVQGHPNYSGGSGSDLPKVGPRQSPSERQPRRR
jgi:hypothetical protein